MISASLKQKIKELAGKSPSPHNVQAWELHFTSDGVFAIEDTSRRLNACDPSLRDHRVALGALIEGLHLILGSEGLGVREILDQSTSVQMKFELKISSGFKQDALYSQIPQRRSYRGVFLKSSIEDIKSLENLFSKDEALVISSKADLKAISRAADKAATESNKSEAIQSELYNWLRLKDSHPRYNVDGLNRAALALPKSIANIADVLLKPAVYRKLDKLGLAGPLNSEAAQINSGTGLVCFQSFENESPIEQGRRLYRLWLKMTASGFYGCPQSSLTDNKEASQILSGILGIKNTFLCLRVGKVNKDSLPASFRRELVHFSEGENEK